MSARVHEIPFIAEEPRPLFREIGAPAPYPVEALGPLRDPARAVQGVTLAPFAVPAQSTLAAASLAVQGHANVETLGGFRPTSLYLLTVARSGERKSSCDARVMSALCEHETDQARLWRDGLARHRDKHALWNREREQILSKGKRANPEDRFEAEADLDALGPEPVAPPLPGLTVSEPTLEGLARKFTEGMPSLGLISDEGGQFLGGFSMKSENRQRTLAALNDLWQGNPINRTRASEAGSTLFGRRLMIHLMVQPGVAEAFLADPSGVDTGFLPRFLICAPESTIGTRLHVLIRHDTSALEAFDHRFRDILETPSPMDAETRALKPRALPLDPDARELLIAFADEVELAQAPGKHLCDIRDFASKAAEQAARIAGVMALWRDLGAAAVTGEEMANGIELARFHLSEAGRLADAATIPPEIRRAELLRVWLLERCAHVEMTPGEIVQFGPSQLRDTATVKSALAVLEAHGWVISLPKGTEVRGKRRKEAYRIVRPYQPT